jgi:hypothetical protein
MLLLKLLIVPLFLCGVSLAARRWGPQIGGLLAGFPVVTGPILFFLSVEQGSEFAARAAQGSLLAVIACIAFGVAYRAGSIGQRRPTVRQSQHRCAGQLD